MFTGNDVLDALIVIGVLLPSIILHEVSHGVVAARLGDPTARDAGRLTLNPIKHVDPIGSILLPAMLWLARGPIFGWAKPVPIQPARFARPTEGMALTAIAGPLTNFGLALLAARLVLPSVSGTLEDVVVAFVVINLFLAVFNLLPIPPLDGSRLLPLVLTPQGRVRYLQFEQYGFLVLFALVFLFRGSLGFLTDLVAWLFRLIT